MKSCFPITICAALLLLGGNAAYAAVTCHSLFSGSSQQIVFKQLVQLRYEIDEARALGRSELASALYKQFQMTYREALRDGIDLTEFPQALGQLQRAGQNLRDAKRLVEARTVSAEKFLVPWRVPIFAYLTFSYSLNRDATRLFTAHDGKIKIYDTNSRQKISEIPLPIQARGVRVSTNGEVLLVASQTEAGLYDLKTGLFKNFGFNNLDVREMEWSQNGKLVMINTRSSADHETLLLDPASAKVIKIVRQDANVAEGAVSADGTRALIGVMQPALYDNRGNKLLRIRGSHARFSPDGSRIASHRLKQIVISDGKTGKEVLAIPTENSPREEPAFSPNGETVGLTPDHEIFRVWSTTTGTKLFEVSARGSRFGHAVYSGDGKRLIVSFQKDAQHSQLMIVDAKTGETLLEIPDAPHAIAQEWTKLSTDFSGMTLLFSDSFTPSGEKKRPHDLSIPGVQSRLTD